MKSKQRFLFMYVLHKCLNKVIALEDTSAQYGQSRRRSRKKQESVFLHYFRQELWIIMKGRHLMYCQMWHNVYFFLEFALVIEDA